MCVWILGCKQSIRFESSHFSSFIWLREEQHCPTKMRITFGKRKQSLCSVPWHSIKRWTAVRQSLNYWKLNINMHPTNELTTQPVSQRAAMMPPLNAFNRMSMIIFLCTSLLYILTLMVSFFCYSCQSYISFWLVSTFFLIATIILLTFRWRRRRKQHDCQGAIHRAFIFCFVLFINFILFERMKEITTFALFLFSFFVKFYISTLHQWMCLIVIRSLCCWNVQFTRPSFKLKSISHAFSYSFIVHLFFCYFYPS